MKHHTTHIRHTLLALACLLAPPLAHAQHPALPTIVPYYDAKACAWLWDTPTQAWTLLPRNEARILHKEGGNIGKQLVGTLTIDGNHAVPVVGGQNVLLAFRKNTDFKTYEGRNETGGLEVVKLDITAGPRKNQLIRTARLQRMGESAATFGDKREPVTIWQSRRPDGVFHIVRVDTPLAPGRYALYLPDRAFEFEVK